MAARGSRPLVQVFCDFFGSDHHVASNRPSEGPTRRGSILLSIPAI